MESISPAPIWRARISAAPTCAMRSALPPSNSSSPIPTQALCCRKACRLPSTHPRRLPDDDSLRDENSPCYHASRSSRRATAQGYVTEDFRGAVPALSLARLPLVLEAYKGEF